MRSPAIINCDEEVSMIFSKAEMSLVGMGRMAFVVLVNDDSH